MPSRETSSLILSLGVFVVAAGLFVWQRFDLSRRESGLSPEDETYFAGQDFRRVLVMVVMLMLAFGVFFGSRVDHRLNGRPNPWFLGTWLAVFWLVIVLMATALLDWLATREYARRHRKEMVREGMLILRDEMKERMRLAAQDNQTGETNGHLSG